MPDGFDFGLVLTAQRMAAEIDNGQPTAIVYRTTKGWKYGIEGKKSHGGGHAMCSPEYFDTQRAVFGDDVDTWERPDPADEVAVEAAQWATLERYRSLLESDAMTAAMADRIARTAKDRLEARGRKLRDGAPEVERIFAAADPATVPGELALAPGDKLALRQALGRALGYLNRESGGAILIGAADLLGSTAISDAAAGFPEGFYHRTANPGARSLSVGGICEDGLSCVLSGASAFGTHVGAVASYGAFLAPLGHIAARLHAIGNQARQETEPGPFRPFVLVCAHAGMKTGEDGPTHADPQALQVLQENFVPGTAITLTPWEPAEMWPLMAAAFAARPAVIVPFVTRPGETVPDRDALGLAPPAGGAGVVPAAAQPPARPTAPWCSRALRWPTPSLRRPCRCCQRRGSTSMSIWSPLPNCSTDARRRATGDLPGGIGPAGDGYHRVHAADHVSVDSQRPGTRPHHVPLREGPLPRVRYRRHGRP